MANHFRTNSAGVLPRARCGRADDFARVVASMITLDEVREFGTRFFDAVAGGASAAQQAHFFLDSHAGIYVAWNGATINLKEHETLHAQWINEHHSFGHFDLTELNASPDRVRARGTVYWQAEFPERPRASSSSFST